VKADRLKRFSVIVWLIVCAVNVHARPASLVSRKQHLSIALDVPARWSGPAYKAWPSYETWSFSKGTDPNISYLEIRVDCVRRSKLDWNTAGPEQIKKTFDDFANPDVEAVAKIMIDGKPIVVWAAHNVDGELLIAKLRHGSCDLNFELRTNSRAELRTQRATFLNALKSVRLK